MIPAILIAALICLLAMIPWLVGEWIIRSC